MEEKNINIKPVYLYLAIVALVLILLSVVHYYRTKELTTRIEARDAINLVHKTKIKELEASVESLQKEKIVVLKKADSLEIQETYYKNRYYATNKKLKELLNDYDNSSDDAKWDAFSGAIKE
jgi:hypothetical protein